MSRFAPMRRGTYSCRQTSTFRSKYDGDSDCADSCQARKSLSTCSNHFLNRPSSLCSTSFFDMSKRHFGRHGHVRRGRSCDTCPTLYKTLAFAIGRATGTVEAMIFVFSRNSGDIFINADCKRLTDSICVDRVFAASPLKRLEPGRETDFSSGDRASPRLIARRNF